MSTDPMATLYHDDTNRTRLDLMTASQHWEFVAAEYRTSRPGTVGNLLYMAALAAGLKSYALAAAIRFVRQEAGKDAARKLAAHLDDLMTNGDDDLIRVEAPAPAPPRLVVVDEAS